MLLSTAYEEEKEKKHEIVSPMQKRYRPDDRKRVNEFGGQEEAEYMKERI